MFDENHVYKSGKFRGLTLRQRLEQSLVVRGSGCWEWTESLFTNGYGSINYKDRKRYGAHRVAAEVLGGMSVGGMVVMHPI